MRESRLRQYLNRIKRTPFHPQWLIFRHYDRDLAALGRLAQGVTLDIGSGRQTVRPHLAPGVTYLPLDYYETAVNWYEFLPAVFGDAQRLPVATQSFDTVFSLDVMEHLPDPNDAMAEIARVLRPGGRAILRIPFLYPLHDRPFDFNRWTAHGLERMVTRHGLIVVNLRPIGNPVQTSALLSNLALTQTMVGWLEERHPLLILLPLLPLFVLKNNLVGALFGRFQGDPTFMPQSYHLMVHKPD